MKRMGRNAELCPSRNPRRNRVLERKETRTRKTKRGMSCVHHLMKMTTGLAFFCGEPYGNSRPGGKWAQTRPVLRLQALVT